MPLLGGLFSKKSKSRSPNSPSNPGRAGPEYSTTALEQESISTSMSISPTTEYVTADKSLPSNPNGKRAANSVYPSVAASSSRLRLFGKKKTTAASAIPVTTDADAPPRPSYVSRTSTAASSGSEPSTPQRKHLKPPPSRSAIFAAYVDSNGSQSTRSLPSERTTRTEPSSPPLPPLPPKRSLFHWPKSQPNSNSKDPAKASLSVLDEKPKQPPHTIAWTTGSDPDTSSFNLKSFRHVRPGSPTHSNSSNVSLSNGFPPPRPRGTSVASDSSTRISVAAFREAQARRSAAGSPSPSLRTSSPLPPITGGKSSNGTEQHPSSSGFIPTHSYSSSKATAKVPPRMSSVFSDDYSDTTASSSEEESDDEGDRRRSGGSASPLGRRRTITQRRSGNGADDSTLKARAKSELGHGSSWAEDTLKDLEQSPTWRQPLSSLAPTRPRASVSASASTPSAAAQRASTLAAANVHLSSSASSKHLREPSLHSSSARRTSTPDSDSNSDSDSDNAPLATLMPPRRPDSAMSSVSGSRSNVNLSSSRPHTPVQHGRPSITPLIDINALMRKKPDEPFTASRAKSTDDAFTPGLTLISSRNSASPSLSATSDTRPPRSFVLPPLELGDQPSRFVSSPTSMVSSSGLPSPRDSHSESGTSDVIPKSDKLFPRKRESKDAVSPPLRSQTSSPLESKKSSRSSGSTDSTPAEKRRDLLSDRLTKVIKQTTGSANTSPNLSKGSSPEKHGHQRRKASTGSLAASGLGMDGDYSSGGIRLVGSGDKPSEGKKEDPIAPIVIRQREPPSSFAVTSRPQHHSPGSVDTTRPRSSTMLSSPSPSSVTSGSGPSNSTRNSSSAPTATPATRQRSTTMMPLMTGSPNVSLFPMPTKPFAMRRDSPASSTGDSSSGRVPLTPRDSSDTGSVSVNTGGSNGKNLEAPKKEEWSSGVSGLGLNTAKGKGHVKRQSVSFEEQQDTLKNKEKAKETPEEEEERRKERRRSEAKAAIELGNVINGRGPIVDDDDDQPINQTFGGRVNMVKPMMGMGGPMPMNFGGSPAGTPSWNNMVAWQQKQGAMLSPAQFMMPSPADPNFLAAHQQAMMIAKQAYQMAVAQQAMAAAGDEWERSSSMGGFSNARSVYGAPTGFGVGLGMGMQGAGAWPSGSMLFPPGPRSMYGGAAMSEYGGNNSGVGGWGSKSVYGETFGPPGNRSNKVFSGQSKPGYGQRDSGYFTPAAAQSPNNNPRGNPRSRTTSGPANPGRLAGIRKAPPPSSWKAAGI